MIYVDSAFGVFERERNQTHRRPRRNLQVHYQDETLSTKEAQAKLLQAQKPQKKRRLDHQAAATIILQAYLDEKD